MLILNQLGNKLVNLDNLESIEIDYHTGNTYSVVKAVAESPWDSDTFNKKSTIKLGEYPTSLQSEAVIESIFAAYDAGCKTYRMPKEMPHE